MLFQITCDINKHEVLFCDDCCEDLTKTEKLLSNVKKSSKGRKRAILSLICCCCLASMEIAFLKTMSWSDLEKLNTIARCFDVSL